jgi:hypothetical protein
MVGERTVLNKAVEEVNGVTEKLRTLYQKLGSKGSYPAAPKPVKPLGT